MRLSRGRVAWGCGLFLSLSIGCQEHPRITHQSDRSLDALSSHVSSLHSQLDKAGSEAEKASLRQVIRENEALLIRKKTARALPRANDDIMKDKLSTHTKMHAMIGEYRILVVPVEFKDRRFDRPEFFAKGAAGDKSQAQDYLFGNHPDSMTQYYRHASFGKFNVTGEVVAPVTVDRTLAEYGEAVTGANDVDARGLVVDVLEKMKAAHQNENWWDSFDNWDTGDYDNDAVYREPDGFIDALVLVYAGKDQATCQRIFDPEVKRPASKDVPAGPRHDAAVECFNRIWPHRWSISLSSSDPRFSKNGPMVEGEQRPSLNGYKINDHLFASDYNMQSEYSDRSTFIHEYGHSIGLPDVYAKSGENSSGAWELMSSNAHLQAQELSTYSKLSLGWLAPKIVGAGQTSSLYLGTYNFVSDMQRDHSDAYTGPGRNEEWINGAEHAYDILSVVPSTDEPVYRSAVALTPPTHEKKKVFEPTAAQGHRSAYSGRFDDETRSLKRTVHVPDQDNATVSLDLLYRVETETNFDGNDAEVKVVTEFDSGEIYINGELKETLKLLSGDQNGNGLAEQNPACEEARVLALRKIKIERKLTEDEQKELTDKRAKCETPVWVTKSYDVSKMRGQDIEIEVRYTTDGGYTEMGILVDNIRTDGGTLIDFENDPVEVPLQKGKAVFKVIQDGIENLTYNQFYLFEYRTPGESFVDKTTGGLLSYNMDNHIDLGSQAIFTPASEASSSLLRRFRLITYDYQPGVLVWYFNGKYNDNENSPSELDGKGYLLVVNANPAELALPVSSAEKSIMDDAGFYKTEDRVYKAYEESQNKQYICFSHTEYSTYTEGVAPDCSAYPQTNEMRDLTLRGKPLRFSREVANNYLPVDQSSYLTVSKPLFHDLPARTGLSTFRPVGAESFAPFKVFKVTEGKLVQDDELTAVARRWAPVSHFDDKTYTAGTHPRSKHSSAVVERAGLSFDVVSPAARIVAGYGENHAADDNEHFMRRPRVKLYIRNQ
jgi:hypothetical protein